MSLIGDPSVIFLDEPTNGLDVQSRNMMWETIKKLADNGTTVFLTTQYLAEAEHLADNVAVLDKGRIVAQDTAGDLKRLQKTPSLEEAFLKIINENKEKIDASYL